VTSPPDRALLSVDLDALAANYAALKAEGGVEVAPVVKADAYGLGAAEVARRLWREGARRFFVARLVEGERLREALGLERPAEILVFDGCFEGAAGRLKAAALTPVLNSGEQARAWRTAGGGAAALMIETGLNRLGATAEETRAIAADHGVEIGLVMSHLACADQPNHPMNDAQRSRFLELSALYPKARRSLAASDGLFLGPAFAFDMARCGICLYGGGPHGEPHPNIRPVATVQAPILQLRWMEVGEHAGYGAAFTATRRTQVAVAAIGYADGVLRSAFPRAYGSLAGRPCPVVGRISMDLTLFDVTDIPEADALPGALAGAMPGAMMEIIGPAAPVDVQAKAAGTIAYELLTRLAGRAERRHVGRA